MPVKPKRRIARKAKPTAKSARSRSAPRGVEPSTVDSKRLRLELDIHREELATQNEELRAANGELMSAKERYAQLYDGAPSAYFTLDEDGKIIEANLAGAELLEASRNFLFGRSFDELIAASSRESFRKFRRRVLGNGGRPTHDTMLALKDRRVPVRVEAARLASETSATDHCLLCVTDETDRRQVDEERRQLDGRVAEARRIESLGMLAGGVAHDFNNILAVALAHADLLLLDATEASPTHAAALEIRDAVTRATLLSQQMLAYSGRGRLRVERVEVSEVIESLRESLASSIPNGVALVFDLGQELPAILGDSVQIEQIILNLVKNAAEAVAPGSGQVVLRTRYAAPPSPAGADALPADRRLLIEVTDDGCGMDEATRSRAFDPFFSTKFAGRGLGLAVVLGSVRAHGGTITIESRLDGGATFRVYLPAIPRPAVAANDVPDELEWRGSGLVLVVDDEASVRDVVGRVLRRIGFQVCFAQDGIDALAVARHPPEALVAVLLDLTMPRLGGAATLAELKRLDPSLPVVLTSGYASTELDKGLFALADGFVPKPFTLAKLLRVMRHAVTAALPGKMH